MKGIFSMDGNLMVALNKLSDVVLISVLWVLCCLPLVTIGASTTAAYYTIVKVVKRQSGTMHKEFFRSFRENFKQSAVINLIYLVLEGILAYNIYYAFGSLIEYQTLFSLSMFYFYLMLFLLVIALAFFTYATLSRFVMRTMKIVRFSMFAVCRHLFTSIVLIVFFLISFFFIVIFPPALIFMPGLFLYVYSHFMEKVLWKYMTEEMRRKWTEADKIVSEAVEEETSD